MEYRSQATSKQRMQLTMDHDDPTVAAAIFTEIQDTNFTQLLNQSAFSYLDSNHTSLLTYFPPGFQLACYVLAGIIATTNGIVIGSFILSRKVRKSMSIFLLNLAIVDFQNGCVSLPLLMLYPRTEKRFLPPGGLAVCIVLLTWPLVLFIVAYYSVLFVTMERFICIVKPYTHRSILKRPRCLGVVILMWLCAVLFSLLPILTHDRLAAHGSLYMCEGEYHQGVVYTHIFLYLVLGLPLVLIITLYVLMYRIARAHTKSIKELNHAMNKDHPAESGKRKLQIAKTSKAAKTACILSSFYLMCWLPFLILLQITELCRLGQCPISMTIVKLQRATPPAIILAFLGCALNPVIYIFRTGTIRTTFIRWCRNSCAERSLNRPKSLTSQYSTGGTRMSLLSSSSVQKQQEMRGMSMTSFNSIF